MAEFQRKSFWRDLKKVVVLQKKVNFSCSNEHDRKEQQKKRNNKGDKNKKQFHKKG